MVAPFGWSAGDLLLSIKILYKISKAFQDAGGSEEEYTLSAAWLQSFAHDLERVKEYITQYPESPCVPGIQEKMLLISSAYGTFERYLIENDILGPNFSSKPSSGRVRKVVSKVKKGATTIRWAWRELDRHVDSLRLAVSVPLAEMSLILLVHLAGQFQHFLAQTSQIPQITDISDLRKMLQEQSERLDSLKDVVYDVQLSLVKNLALAGLDEKRECRIKKNVSQAIERVHQLRRHLNTFALDEQTLHNDVVYSKENADKELFSREQQHKEIYQDFRYVKDQIEQRLDAVSQDLATLETKTSQLITTQDDSTSITQDLHKICLELIPNFSEKIDELRTETEHRTIKLERTCGLAVFQTGASVAAATTGIVCLLMSVHEYQSRMPKARSNMVFPRGVSQVGRTPWSVEFRETGSFECAWKYHRSKREGQKLDHQASTCRTRPETERKISPEPAKIEDQLDVLEERWPKDASGARGEEQESENHITTTRRSEAEKASASAPLTPSHELLLAAYTKLDAVSH